MGVLQIEHYVTAAGPVTLLSLMQERRSTASQTDREPVIRVFEVLLRSDRILFRFLGTGSLFRLFGSLLGCQTLGFTGTEGTIRSCYGSSFCGSAVRFLLSLFLGFPLLKSGTLFSLLFSSLGSSLFRISIDVNQAFLAYPRADIPQQHALREALGTELINSMYLVPNPDGRTLAGQILHAFALDHHGVAYSYLELMFLRRLCFLLCRQRRHNRSAYQSRCNKN